VGQADGRPTRPSVDGALNSTVVGSLDGIRVVEAGLLVQGPQAAATLAEWGAEVVKVELPGFGDQARWLFAGPDDRRSPYFVACNRGKRSVTMDLRKEQGRLAFLRLVDRADVLITNFAPGTMERWNLGYDVISARNPGIVYASGSTFGDQATVSVAEGADLSGQAAGGLISTTGETGSGQTPVGATIADHIAAQNLVAGVLAALLARERHPDRVGQAVTTSLIGGQIWAQAGEITACLLTGRPAGPANRGNPLVPALYGIFATADGSIAIVGLVGAERRKFFDVIGRPELADRFAQPLYWADDKAALFPLVDEAMGAATTAQWCERLSAAGLRHAPVRDHAQVCADPDVWANGYLTTVEGPDGPEPVVSVPVRFGATPGQPQGGAPRLGQHTDQVLGELGFSPAEIAGLRRVGAV